MVKAISDRRIDLRQELVLLSKKEIPYKGRNVKGQVTLLSHRANRVLLACTTDTDAFLYASDTYYPGWRAFIDGKPTPLYRADLAFRAIHVPKGDHTIVFTYVPLSFYSGLILTAIGLFACVGIVVEGWQTKEKGCVTGT